MFAFILNSVPSACVVSSILPSSTVANQIKQWGKPSREIIQNCTPSVQTPVKYDVCTASKHSNHIIHLANATQINIRRPRKTWDSSALYSMTYYDTACFPLGSNFQTSTTPNISRSGKLFNRLKQCPLCIIMPGKHKADVAVCCWHLHSRSKWRFCKCLG